METLLPNLVICGLKLMTRSTFQIPTLSKEQTPLSGKVGAGLLCGTQRAPPSAGGAPGGAVGALCAAGPCGRHRRDPRTNSAPGAPGPRGRREACPGRVGAAPGRFQGGSGAAPRRARGGSKAGPAGPHARPPPAQAEREPRADPAAAAAPGLARARREQSGRGSGARRERGRRLVRAARGRAARGGRAWGRRRRQGKGREGEAAGPGRWTGVSTNLRLCGIWSAARWKWRVRWAERGAASAGSAPARWCSRKWMEPPSVAPCLPSPPGAAGAVSPAEPAGRWRAGGGSGEAGSALRAQLPASRPCPAGGGGATLPRPPPARRPPLLLHLLFRRGDSGGDFVGSAAGLAWRAGWGSARGHREARRRWRCRCRPTAGRFSPPVLRAAPGGRDGCPRRSEERSGGPGGWRAGSPRRGRRSEPQEPERAAESFPLLRRLCRDAGTGISVCSPVVLGKEPGSAGLPELEGRCRLAPPPRREALVALGWTSTSKSCLRLWQQN